CFAQYQGFPPMHQDEPPGLALGTDVVKEPMDTDTFVSQLWQLGLLYNRRMERAVNEGLARSPDARSLARELIQQNVLTPFQANQNPPGKGQTVGVGKFRLMEPLGQSRPGHRFKAGHMAMDRLVTLRRLPPEMAADPKARARFQRVVQVLAHLAHPNLPA